MPNYRNGGYEKPRRPMSRDEQERKYMYKPEWDGEEEDIREDRKPVMRPCPQKFLFPFMVEVRVIPCDDHKRPQYR